MPDHLHLILHPHGNTSLPEIMHRIKGIFARYYNQLNQTQGAVWQKGYFEKAIRDEHMLKETLSYLHNNPLRKALIEDPEDYPYSSFNYYENNEKRYELLLTPPPW